MGIYIDMEIPENCWVCELHSVVHCPVDSGYGGKASYTDYIEKRHPECPLVRGYTNDDIMQAFSRGLHLNG